jgi:hypothetical protein
VDNDVLVELLLKERSYSGDDADRHGWIFEWRKEEEGRRRVAW